MGISRTLIASDPARSPKRSDAPVDFFDYTRALDALAERHVNVGSLDLLQYLLMRPERAHAYGKGWSSQPGDPDPLHWALFGRTRLPLIPCDDPDTNIYPLTLNTPADVRTIADAFGTLDRAALVQHPAVPAILADPFMRTIPPQTAEGNWVGIEALGRFYQEAATHGWEVYSYQH